MSTLPTSARSIAASVDIQASADQVFAVWAAIDRWHLWDPDTQRAGLCGPLSEGAAGWLTPAKGRRVPMVVERLEPGRRLKVRCPVWGSALHFDHHLLPLAAGGVRATHEAWFTGWAAPLFRALLARQLSSHLPVTMAALKRHVERGTHTGC